MSASNGAVIRQHFQVIQFMHESGSKLGLTAIPLATACQLYHKFFKVNQVQKYDCHTIGTACLYLGGKVEEQYVKVRDVVNVCHRILHKDEPPLDVNPTYWDLRNSIIQCEMMILRTVAFHVSFKHPHKYLLHYLKTLNDWMPPGIVANIPICRTAWALLRDSYHINVCLHHKAEHIAVAILYFSLQCYGVQVPYTFESRSTWWQALCDDISIETIREIITNIINMYLLENTV